ncbi:hypothetical protein [Psychroflexus planctonicus]|uniref:Uncharacterized protein n=1 Tax=Psychroflexus planctonicus TaxID=1526575 RepID=A0ABQ1SH54_9FLAO|nr:hypothetical protein [Psychroflexus planctonicus]GGE35190.1 hypothetical protein GCM10010832_14170 [Psychroflexus planctonicus]
MKKVLEGELTSLAHSILKSKGDNVHELKEKAGLLYEKLCVLSFAEKHFAGKQPNIGKAAFKSAFEMDLDEVITPDETTPKPEKESLPVEKSETKENASTENLAPEKSISEEEESTQIEAAEEKEENSTPTEAISTEKQATFQPKTHGLSEEDFGVHFDELPDFEPAPEKASTQKPAEEVNQPSKEEAKSKEVSTEETTERVSDVTEDASIENKDESEEPNTEEEKPKPQRTMDLFSQDKKSLNDQLKTELKIGLNDRLAFTKKLFDGNIEAYNRVMAKMSEFSSFQEAKTYLTTQVKPNYAWEEHEAVKQRFLEILEAKLG